MWKKTVDRPLLAYGQDLVVGTIPVRPSGGFDLGPGGVPKAQYQAFTLVDTFKSGYWESDASHVYVPFDVAQRLAGMAGRPAEGEDPGEPPRTSQVQVRLAPGAEAEAVVRAVERAWFDFIAARRPKDFAFPVVNTWETQQRTILGVVEMERNITALMLGVMLIGFAILTALISYVMAYIKGRDVGILKALGASDAGVGSLFLGYGFVIGLLGTAIGLGAALAMLHWLDPIEMYVNQFIGRPVFPRDVYYFDRIPRNLSAAWAVGVSLAVLALSTLASMAGGLLAALKQPVETLRYE
jgi:lipoprotein-releasing system permease protein